VSTALVGFIGVIAGGVVTGAVGWVGAWLDRSRARRTAARLIYGDLVLATSDLEAYLQVEHWRDEVWSLPRYVEAWGRHAEALSTAGIVEFNIVAAAFKRLETLIGIRALPGGEENRGWGSAVLRIVDDIDVVKRAGEVALEVGCTRREKNASDEKWEKYRRSVTASTGKEGQ
jgi:hypothetical protein